MRLRDRLFLSSFLPVIRLTQRVAKTLESQLRKTASSDQSAAKALKSLKDVAAEEGILEDEERKMIDHIYEFSETLAREVMVPRVDMVCVDVEGGLDEVVRVIRESGHSRIPVYRESVDYVEGIVYAKDLLLSMTQEPAEASVLELARKPFFIPETKKIDDLLRDLRRTRVHMAIVVDEYGGTAGLVTLEDLLEEIVGEIQDEYDEEEPEYVVLGPGHFRVDARMNLDDLNELTGAEMPTESVDTIGGFIYDLLGRIPEEGERLSWDELQFVVEKIEGQRIATVIVKQEISPE
jgi:putative hemolysin